MKSAEIARKIKELLANMHDALQKEAKECDDNKEGGLFLHDQELYNCERFLLPLLSKIEES